MKKHSFLAGMLTMALIVGLGMSALAATGQVSFNASALTLNGTQVSAKGENYTLSNGQSVPASITYTDEKGGGTTYLPVRRISELLGVETGWDGTAGAVTVKGEVKTPETTTPPADYSTWSAEDEAAYQEFKGLWEVTLLSKGDTRNVGNGIVFNEKFESYKLFYIGHSSKESVSQLVSQAKVNGVCERLASEISSGASGVYVGLSYCFDRSASEPLVENGLIFIREYLI